jgi:hypothetical protein
LRVGHGTAGTASSATTGLGYAGFFLPLLKSMLGMGGNFLCQHCRKRQ